MTELPDWIRINDTDIKIINEDKNVVAYQNYTDRCEGRVRTTKLVLCEWAKHLHGNPPGGTKYGHYRFVLPNGKRINYNIYI